MDDEDELAAIRVEYDPKARNEVLERMRVKNEFEKMLELARRHR